MIQDKRLFAQALITGVALLLVLVYNFVHTGGLLASYVTPPAVGFVAAVGIELSVVGLSLQIGRRKHDKQDAGFFYFVLVSVVIVSALANVAQGHLQRYGNDITIDSLTTIDIIQGIIGIAATALLSLIVMAMAEIVGQFIERDVVVPDATGEQPQTKTETVLMLIQEDPTMSVKQLANAADCSTSLVRHAMRNNGNG